MDHKPAPIRKSRTLRSKEYAMQVEGRTLSIRSLDRMNAALVMERKSEEDMWEIYCLLKEYFSGKQ